MKSDYVPGSLSNKSEVFAPQAILTAWHRLPPTSPAPLLLIDSLADTCHALAAGSRYAAGMHMSRQLHGCGWLYNWIVEDFVSVCTDLSKIPSLFIMSQDGTCKRPFRSADGESFRVPVPEFRPRRNQGPAPGAPKPAAGVQGPAALCTEGLCAPLRRCHAASAPSPSVSGALGGGERCYLLSCTSDWFSSSCALEEIVNR